MSFLFPQAFFLAFLIPAIVLLYLHRSRRKTTEVSSLLFWQRVIERAPRRRFLGVLRNPLSLLLQLLIFLLLLAALARPEFGSVAVRRSAVIVIDARARMQADGEGPFRQALDEARAIAATAGADAEVAILAAEGTPQIVSPFSSDAKELRKTLAGLAPSDAGGSIDSTLVLARRLLKARPGEGRLVVISDRPVMAEGVEEILVGHPRDNRAILQFAAKPLPASPQSVELFLKAGNFSPEAREVEVEFLLDGRVFDLRKQTVAAGEQADFTALVPAELLQKGKGFLTAQLTGTDALSFDDVAYAFVPPDSRVRTLLLSKGNPFLEKALASDPAVALEILLPGQWRTGLESGFDVVVFDDWLPDQATLENVGERPVFFYGKSPMDVPDVELPGNVFEVADPQSPLLWNVNLKSARLARMHELTLPAAERWRVQVPVESSGDPALVSLENSSGRRMVATAFGTEDSNLSLRTAFPLMVSNIVHWLARHNGDRAGSFLAGQTFIPARNGVVSRGPTPDGASESAAKAPSLTEGPQMLRKNGFYEVREEGTSQWIAVNTADAVESDLRAAMGTQLHFGWTGLHMIILRPWHWLALVALALLLLEWRWHHRRVTE